MVKKLIKINVVLIKGDEKILHYKQTTAIQYFTILVLTVNISACQLFSATAKDFKKTYENGCPFGVCMAMEPKNLYTDAERAKIMLKNNYSAGMIDNVVNLNFIDQFITSPADESYEYSAYWSNKTGVCSVRLSVNLYSEKREDFIYNLREYIKSLTGEEAVERTIGNDQLFLWDGEGLNFNEVDLVALRFTYIDNQKDVDKKFATILEFRFNNFQDCRKYEPLIPN